MNQMFKFPVAFVFVWLLIPSAMLAADDEGFDAERVNALFEWFDQLGYPGLAKDPQLVSVATGRWSSTNGRPPENQLVVAFLIDDDAEKFRIVSLDLGVVTYQKTPLGKTPEHERVGFRRTDLGDYVERLLPTVEGADQLPTGERHHRKLPLEAQLFVLARACHAQGRGELAVELLTLAEANRNRRHRAHDDFQLRIGDDLCRGELWRGVLRFGHPKIPRTELLEHFRSITSRFPKSYYRSEAEEIEGMLAKMVEEDRLHVGPAKGGAPTEEQRIAELIFRLRDQNGIQTSQPGACDIFYYDEYLAEPSPAGQLVDLGFAAVPQLIEALDDERFSRSVGYTRNFFYSHHILRVSDCAAAVLRRLSGQSFWAGRGEDRTAKQVAAKVRAELWWKEVQAKGASEFLSEMVVLGGQPSVGHATRLARQFPQEALKPIEQGIRKSKDAWTRANLVRIAGELPGDAPLELLWGEMRNGPNRRTRAAAAVALWERGKPEALAAMIKGWTKRPKVDPGSWADWGNALDAHWEFLAHCGEVSAVLALGDRFVESPIRWRYSIVRAMHTGERLRHPKDAKPDPGPIAEELREAIEELLWGALQDTGEFDRMIGKWDGVSFANPRICDLAGHVLANRWPDKFKFDLGADAEGRERQRLQLLESGRDG